MRAFLWLSVLCMMAGCRCSRESEQIAGAVESFIDFGMSNEERAKAPAKASKHPHLHERSRKAILHAPGGPRLEVEVNLPHHIDSKSVSDALSIELERLLGEGNYRQIKLSGRPNGLDRYGGRMGLATARRGRDNEIRTKVVSFVRDDQPVLTKTQYEALVDLELALARAPSGKTSQTRASMRERHGAKMLDGAIKAAKRRFRF